MEEKKKLNEKELEKVNGGSEPGIDMNEVPGSTPFAGSSELDEYAQRDKRVK